MKNVMIFTLSVLSIMFKVETVAAQDVQKDGSPKVTTTAFIRYAAIGNSTKNVPFMHANLAGVNVSYKRFSVEVAYLRNHTLQRDGNDVDDSILSEVIACEETGKAYRIIANELQFYKEYNIPLPRLHPETRFKKRFEKMNGTTLYERQTADGVNVKTSYTPDDPHKILSEEGYQQEVM